MGLLLLENGADIMSTDHEGLCLLYHACERQMIVLVSFLLDNGAKDSNAVHSSRVCGSPFLVACYLENFEIVKMIIVNIVGDTIIYDDRTSQDDTGLDLACFNK